jgi:hypothetical protein
MAADNKYSVDVYDPTKQIRARLNSARDTFPLSAGTRRNYTNLILHLLDLYERKGDGGGVGETRRGIANGNNRLATGHFT